MATALAVIAPDDSGLRTFKGAVRCLLVDLWSGIPFLNNEIEALLAGSWAGENLRAMKDHQAARKSARRAHEEFMTPGNVEQWREQKKRLKLGRLSWRAGRCSRLPRV